MGPAGFDNALVFLLQATQGFGEPVNGGNYPVFYGDYRSDMHSGRECVIGGLGHVDVIVGMQQHAAGKFICTVCDNLVGIHIALGSGTGLPYDQREMVVELAGDNLVAGLTNEL